MTFASLSKKLKETLSSRYSEREIHFIHYRILEKFCNASITEIISHPDRILTASEEHQILAFEDQLIKGVPLQYALGITSFLGLEIFCTPAALIPRPETEELVDWILSTNDASPNSVIDIGTGTGCIALSLKNKRSNWVIAGMDVSEDALNLARKNAKFHAMDIEWHLGDIVKLSATKFHNQFSIIVSNPPYISLDESTSMEPNVLDFEPHLALFVPTEDALLYYRHILDWAILNLKDKGWIYFEINPIYSDEMVREFKNRGFINIELKKDLQGKYRMIKGQIVFLSSES